MVTRLVNQSIGGDLRATKMVYELLRELEREGRSGSDEHSADTHHDPDDQAIIARFLAKQTAAGNG